MKKVLVLCMLFLAVSIQAQEPLSFEKVIQADSIKKDAIYNGLKEWVGMSFKSAKNVIEMDDKEAGILLLRPVSDYKMKGLTYLGFEGYLKYTIKLNIKDGRFKVVITNFEHSVLPGNCKDCNLGLITTDEEYPYKYSFGAKGHMTKVWKDIKVKSELIALNYFEEISKIKFKSTAAGENDNW